MEELDEPSPCSDLICMTNPTLVLKAGSLFQKYADVFARAARSLEGINLNSHGQSDGTPVLERNP